MASAASIRAGKGIKFSVTLTKFDGSGPAVEGEDYQGPIDWTVENPAVGRLQLNDDGLSGIAWGVGEGSTAVTGRVDDDLSDATDLIVVSGVLNVSAGRVRFSPIEFGEEVDAPDGATPPAV